MAKFIEVFETGQYRVKINVDHIVYITPKGKDEDKDPTIIYLSNGEQLEVRSDYVSVERKINDAK